MQSGQTATTRKRRGDIQGLRAVGALLVAIYHIWVGRVSGGVDVFFIVSGYLLIGSLGRQAASGAPINLFHFATRLARRLLPASLFVIAVIVASAPFWLPKTRWLGTTYQFAASTAYVENWYLAFASIDYLARSQIGSVVQHYWAMSAQVQALLILAACLAALTLVRRRVSPITVLSFLVGISALSLAYSIYATQRNQAFAYFDSFARIWEFALGGIVALVLPRLSLTATQRVVGGWLGFALILSCGILLEVSTVFPGYAALWPTLAAAAILLCGEGPPLRYGVERLLAAPPLVWFGNISYSLYLWHWPVLVIYLTLWGESSAGIAAGFGVLAVSIVLAYLTTQLVERPMTAHKGDDRPWRTVFGTAGAVAAIAACLFVWKLQIERDITAEQQRIADAGRYPGAAAIDNAGAAPDGIPIHPGPFTVKWDNAEVYRGGCHQTLYDDALLSCSFGPKDAPNVLALVGGSHSAHWLPVLQSLLQRYEDWRIVTFTKSSCVLSTEQMSKVTEYQESCQVWNERLIARLTAEKPALVFTTSTRVIGGREEIPFGYQQQWQKLLDAGIGVVAIRDTPWFGFDVPECVEVHGPLSPRCAKDRAALPKEITAPLAIPRSDNLHFLDLTDRFCTDTECPPVIGNVMVYYDSSHVTATYMRTLSDDLRKRLLPILRRYTYTAQLEDNQGSAEAGAGSQ
ncbi:MAG: acyltransferase family protein [Kiloniellaceae bacterium]|nr:acyltransferase family protein [Kiloniellaceae bacterium]